MRDPILLRGLVATAGIVALAAIDLVSVGGLHAEDATLAAAGALPVILFGLAALSPHAR